MHNRQDELDRLLRGSDTPENLDAIDSLVTAECRYENGRYFSGFIGVFAEAMIVLGERGRLKITNDNGGRVVEGFKLSDNKSDAPAAEDRI